MRSGSVLLFRGKHSPGICMRLCVYLGPKCIFTAKSIIALNAVAYWGNQNVFAVQIFPEFRLNSSETPSIIITKI